MKIVTFTSGYSEDMIAECDVIDFSEAIFIHDDKIFNLEKFIKNKEAVKNYKKDFESFFYSTYDFTAEHRKKYKIDGLKSVKDPNNTDVIVIESMTKQWTLTEVTQDTIDFVNRLCVDFDTDVDGFQNVKAGMYYDAYDLHWLLGCFCETAGVNAVDIDGMEKYLSLEDIASYSSYGSCVCDTHILPEINGLFITEPTLVNMFSKDKSLIDNYKYYISDEFEFLNKWLTGEPCHLTTAVFIDNMKWLVETVCNEYHTLSDASEHTRASAFVNLLFRSDIRESAKYLTVFYSMLEQFAQLHETLKKKKDIKNFLEDMWGLLSELRSINNLNNDSKFCKEIYGVLMREYYMNETNLPTILKKEYE